MSGVDGMNQFTVEGMSQSAVNARALAESRVRVLNLLIQDGKLNKVQEFLRNSNIDINAVDSFGLSPVCCAIINHRNEILDEFLKQERVDIKHTDKQGNSVLHVAAAFNGYALDRILEKYGQYLDLNVINTTDSTPLHAAAENLNADSVLILLNHNVNQNLLDKKMLTPVFLAVQRTLESNPYYQMIGEDLIVKKMVEVLKVFVDHGKIPPKESMVAFLKMENSQKEIKRIEAQRKSSAVKRQIERFGLNQVYLQSIQDLILNTLYPNG